MLSGCLSVFKPACNENTVIMKLSLLTIRLLRNEMHLKMSSKVCLLYHRQFQHTRIQYGPKSDCCSYLGHTVCYRDVLKGPSEDI